MHPHDWLPALLTAFWATGTFACTVPQDLRPYSQRLADAPLAFIGTVTSVSGLRVTFAVHHAINGAPGPSTAVEALTPSTCSIAFAVGQRWLYAGPATSQPSVLLLANARSTPANDFGRLRRVDDNRALFPAAWQGSVRFDGVTPLVVSRACCPPSAGTSVGSRLGVVRPARVRGPAADHALTAVPSASAATWTSACR